MTTLTIHIENSDQDTALRLFLDALHIPYEEVGGNSDETEYLNSSPAMVARLNEAKAQEIRGEGVKVSLDDIWK